MNVTVIETGASRCRNTSFEALATSTGRRMTDRPVVRDERTTPVTGLRPKKDQYRCCIYCLDLPDASCGQRCTAKEKFWKAYKMTRSSLVQSPWSSGATPDGCSIYCADLDEACCGPRCTALLKLNILEEEESKFLRQRDADRVEKTIQRSNAIVTRMAIEDHVWKRKLAAYDAEAYPPLPDGVEHCDLTLAQRRARLWHANSVKHP